MTDRNAERSRGGGDAPAQGWIKAHAIPGAPAAIHGVVEAEPITSGTRQAVSRAAIPASTPVCGCVDTAAAPNSLRVLLSFVVAPHPAARPLSWGC